MPWFRIDDTWADHPKMLAATEYLSDDDRLEAMWAQLAWVHGGVWCSLAKTDGEIPNDAIRSIASKACLTIPEFMAGAERLVAAGTWKRSRSKRVAFVIHDFRTYNPLKQQIVSPDWKRERADELHRSAEGRRLKRMVEARDANHCRYCDVELVGGREASPQKRTFDHVDPEGSNSLDNVVLACWRCNRTKTDLQLHEVGFELLPPWPSRH